MISMQTNLTAFSGFKYSSSKTTGQGSDKKSISNHTIAEEIFKFSLKVNIDAGKNLGDQNAVFHFNQLNSEDKNALLYDGAPISGLSLDKANELIGKDGYFGVAKTSQRIIDFVISGAGDDVERLKAGREGVLRGFSEAEKAWGGALPGVCCQTLDASLKAIDDKIADLGGGVPGITV